MLAHPPQVDQPEAPGFPAEHDVLGDREVGHQVDLLVHGRDAGLLGLRRPGERDVARPRTEMDPESIEYTPVRALIRVDLPAPFSPISACTSPGNSRNDTSLQRLDSGEGDGDAAHLDHRPVGSAAIVDIVLVSVLQARS